MVPRKYKHADMIRQWLDDDSLVVIVDVAVQLGKLN